MAKKTQTQRAPAAVHEPVEAVNLAVDEVAPSPFQVRQDFPEDEIAALAQSIAAQGQITPIVVRVNKACISGPGHFELIDGERRWRAVQTLKWATIRAEIQHHTDAQARAIVLASAMQRKDLNPIERARAMRQMLDAGDAAGPTELAKQLGLAQGTVSNLLRLLELPDTWQERVISREMTERHARAVLAWKDYPLIMDRIERMTEGQGSEGPGYERFCHGRPWEFDEHTVDQFEEEIIGVAVEDCTRPMDGPSGDGHYYDARRAQRVPIFTPTAEQDKALGIILFNEGQRATNVDLWEQLQEAFLAEQDGDGDQADAKAKPAQKKAAKADAGQQAEQYTQRLYDFQIDWLCWLIADELRQRTGESTLLGLLAYALGSVHVQDLVDVDDAMREAGIKPKKARGTPSLVALLGCDANRVANVAGHVAAQLFWGEDEARSDVFGDVAVEEIAKALGVDVAEAWTAEHCGPLTERYWLLHTAEQLRAVNRQLSFAHQAPVAATKADLVRTLLNEKPTDKNASAMPLPKELAKIKRRGKEDGGRGKAH